MYLAQSLKTLGFALIPRGLLAASRNLSSWDTAVRGRQGHGGSQTEGRVLRWEGERGHKTLAPARRKLLPCGGVRQVALGREGKSLCCEDQQEKDPQDSPAWLHSQVMALASSSLQRSW